MTHQGAALDWGEVCRLICYYYNAIAIQALVKLCISGCHSTVEGCSVKSKI